MYSLTDSRGFGDFNWVGFQNYFDMFKDSRILNSYLFTFKFAITATIVVNVISICLAVLLNSKLKEKVFQRFIFLPNILGGLVVGYVFNFFLHLFFQALVN